MWFFLCCACMNSAILYDEKTIECICLSTGKKTFKLIWRDKGEISWMSSVEWIHTVSPAIMIHFICTKVTDTTYVVPILISNFFFNTLVWNKWNFCFKHKHTLLSTVSKKMMSVLVLAGFLVSLDQNVFQMPSSCCCC